MVQVKKPVALQSDEQSFIEKTLHYISGIRGAIKSNLVLSTNTKFPTRYIILIRGLPTMSINDFDEIKNMNENIRSIKINMAEECIVMDIWRSGKMPNRKKRKRHSEPKNITAKYDLSSVDKRDRKCLNTLLVRLNSIEELECQFDVHIDTSQPEFYALDLSIFDSLKINSILTVLHSCRSFCSDFEFDFPKKIIRAKCLRLAAPLKRKHMRLKNTM